MKETYRAEFVDKKTKKIIGSTWGEEERLIEYLFLNVIFPNLIE